MSKQSKKEERKTKNTYLIKRENISDSEAKLFFKVPAKELDKGIAIASEELAKEIKVDGFRKGKIPQAIVKKEVGADHLLSEGANKIIREHYVNAVIDNKLQAIGEPKIEVQKLVEGQDLEFVATVGLLPEVKLDSWEEEIKTINSKHKGEKIEVKEEEVDRELEYLAQQRAKVVTVNRVAKKGDQVEIDFQAFQNRVVLEGGSAQKHPVVIGENKFIPGFEDELIGTKAGEEKEFDLKFPKEYHVKHLAGKEVTFKVKINLVQERELPKIDDKFASGIGKFKNLEELKKNIKDGLEHEKEHQEENIRRKEVLDSLISKAKFSVPEILVNQELTTMLAELEQDVARIGLTKEKYLEQIKKSEDELKEQWRKKEAPDRVKGALILRYLAQKQKISPSSEEIEKQANQAMGQMVAMGQKQEELDVQRIYEATRGNLTNEKVFKWLTSL